MAPSSWDAAVDLKRRYCEQFASTFRSAQRDVNTTIDKAKDFDHTAKQIGLAVRQFGRQYSVGCNCPLIYQLSALAVGHRRRDAAALRSMRQRRHVQVLAGVVPVARRVLAGGATGRIRE